MSETKDPQKERIAKVIARAGLCSRRQAEQWIADGRVEVNGKALDTPAFTVGPRDRIVVDGNPLPEKEDTRLFIFHKPIGCLTTNKDPQGRKTVFDLMPDNLPRLITVGRLDFNTEGLLLLTNDGELGRYLENPATALKRTYRIRAHGSVTQEQLDGLKDGVTVSGIHYGPIEAKLEKNQGANVWVEMKITEGKNREVRKVMESLGLEVNRLIRTSYGPFSLGAQKKAQAKEIPAPSLRKLLAEFFRK